jgi:hypothetical protein
MRKNKTVAGMMRGFSASLIPTIQWDRTVSFDATGDRVKVTLGSTSVWVEIDNLKKMVSSL